MFRTQFIMAFFAFLLPFCNIHCGEETVEVRGYEFVTGKHIAIETPLSVMLLGKGAKQQKSVDVNPYAVTAVLAIISTLAFSFFERKKALRWLMFTFGALAAIGLIAFQWDIRRQTQSQQGVSVDFLFGYHLALITACLGALVAGIYVWQYAEPLVTSDVTSDVPKDDDTASAESPNL